MYKIEFIPTGHTFELPDITAQELKEKYPDDYKILEKNGKKYRDKIKKKVIIDNSSIYEKVIDKGNWHENITTIFKWVGPKRIWWKL